MSYRYGSGRFVAVMIAIATDNSMRKTGSKTDSFFGLVGPRQTRYFIGKQWHRPSVSIMPVAGEEKGTL